jgi:alanine racemase
MTLKSRIVTLKEPEAGETVGYGRARVLSAGTKVAAVPAGYADGLHRVCSNRLSVLVQGRRTQVLGRICMDMCMIDVTDFSGIGPGSEITIFGEGLPLDEAAELAGTITYELLCSVSPRVPRVYR